MAEKRGFWGNFWSETGTNAGKWASNKVFGPTGWATPRRYLFQGDDLPLKGQIGKRSNHEATPSADPTPDPAAIAKTNLMALALEIEFKSNDPADISGKLDDLLTAANKADMLQVSLKIFEPKINSGLHRLRQVGDIQSASFYENQWSALQKSRQRQQYLPVILMVVVTLLLLLVLQWIT
jgi:hypothetical protein